MPLMGGSDRLGAPWRRALERAREEAFGALRTSYNAALAGWGAPDEVRMSTNVTLANAVLFERWDRLPRALATLALWGEGTAATVAASVARYPHRAAIVDDDGAVTYQELWRASNWQARALADQGIGCRSTVGVLARNSRTFVELLLAASKLGADVVLLNTDFAAPQLAESVATERIDLVAHDDECAQLARLAGITRRWSPSHGNRDGAGYDDHELQPPRAPGRLVLLTSGTTGHPKGAARRGGGSLTTSGAFLERVPLHVGDTVVIAPPLFHGWGLTALLFVLGLAGTAVVHRRFDSETVLGSVAARRADALVVVPVMLSRICALGGAALVGFDTSSLRVIAASGSALPAPLAREVLNRFGPVLYNLYGSSEVALAAIATPADLAAAPGTVGRPVLGSTVRLYDDDGRQVAPGNVGHVFVGNALRFDGYTDGGDKLRRDGLVSTGDLGHFDEKGRLFIDGRDDDMIISGGENVFPAEVEETLATHPAVAEAAVIGVADGEFGQRLRAYVVLVPDAEAAPDELRAFVHDRLARYKVPREVMFLDALPRTPTGKVVRRLLGDEPVAAS